MRARVIAPWKVTYPDPLTVAAGESVTVGRDDPEWPGWRWCTDARGKSGWVPVTLLDGDGPVARIGCDYTARELAAAEGDEVEIERTMHGWAWCRSPTGAAGWMPARNLAPTAS
jgi:SH3-like domain-containing protein